MEREPSPEGEIEVQQTFEGQTLTVALSRLAPGA